MPVAYRKAPRALVLPPNHRAEQPSDDDFTVLLQRDQPRLGLVPPASMRRSSAPPAQRVDRGDSSRPPPPQAALRYPDAESSAPGTAVTVVPPAPRTARQERPRWQTLVMGAGVFLAFGCISGIAVELALSERPHASASEIAEPAGARAPVAAAAQVVAPAAPTTTANVTPPPAPIGTVASAIAHAPPSAAAPAEPPARPVHRHRRHHHVAHPAPVVSHPAPAPPEPAPAVADPSAVAPDDTDPAPAASSPAPAPSAAPGAPMDDMAAAMQTLNQAKAEEAL